ncbi:MAG: aquaporin [bacterium]|nr:aquaporin [bacterium]
MTEHTVLSSRKLIQSFLAEFIGTFFLSLVILTLVGGARSEWTPVVVGALIGLMIYLVGGISGGQFNPSVTVGLVSAGLLSWKHALVNICGQVVGALIGFWISFQFLAMEVEFPAPVSNEWLYELIGAFLLSFAVAAVVRKHVPPALSGFVVGLALTMGILLSESVSGGVLNPAIALAGQIYSWHYIIAPLIGGVLAQYAYLALVRE